MNTIKIYGPGCTKCKELELNVRAILAEMDGEYDIKKISDPMQFASAGVFMTPGLTVNGQLIFSGKNPSKEELKQILNDALGMQATPTSSACSCGSSCCSESKKQASTLKRSLMWACIMVLLFAGIKLYNRNSNEAEQEAIAQAEALQQDGIVLNYFELGTRCPTCIRMGNWITEAITENFADELQSGRLSFQLGKPSTEQVSLYQLTTKSLIASKIIAGQEVNWINFDQIWALKDDEAAFKSYIIEETNKALK